MGGCRTSRTVVNCHLHLVVWRGDHCAASLTLFRLALSPESIPRGGDTLRVRNLAGSACLLAALSFGVAACGSDNKDSSSTSSSSSSGGTGSTSLTIYSSLPLQG